MNVAKTVELPDKKNKNLFQLPLKHKMFISHFCGMKSETVFVSEQCGNPG